MGCRSHGASVGRAVLRRAAGAVGAATVLPLLLAGVAHADPGRCAVIDGTGRCLVAAADPGRPGGPTSPRRTPDGSGRPRDRVTQSEPELGLEDLPVIGDLIRAANAQAPRSADRGRRRSVAAFLAQQAVEQLVLQPPTMRLSARGAGFVGVPVWLWIERGTRYTGPVSVTAVAGAARVEATGRLVGVEWSMGPPGARVTCRGPGTPWTGQTGPSPDCGYVYAQRSLPVRTGGTGRWAVTATSIWRVEWSGTSGGVPVAGGQTVRVSSRGSLAVGEVQVLVSGGGG